MIGIGTALRQAREEQGFSLKEMQKKTNIQIEYLLALEEEKFAQLPSRFYTRGFLRAYAKSLKLDSTYLLELYEGKQSPQTNAVSKVAKKAVSSSIPRLGDPAFSTKRIQVDNKLTMSQIETFSPRRDIQKSKRRQKHKHHATWLITVFTLLICLLVGWLVFWVYE